MRNPFFCEVAPDGTIESPPDVHLHVGDIVWTGPGTTVPVFWTTLFAREEIGGEISRASRVARFDERRASWMAKCSLHLARGYEGFSSWVARQGDVPITLDLSMVAAWRRAPFVDAVRQLIDFLDDKSPEPGPLLSGWSGCVVWKRGKTSTLASLYDQHAQAVWAYARARAPRRDLAEDLLEEAFLALARRLHDRGVPDDALGYLLATVRSRIIDDARRRRPQRLASMPAAPASDDRERRERVFAAVATLPPPLAEAVALHALAGLTFEAAARIAGVPRGTLESRYELALAKLAPLLKDEVL